MEIKRITPEELKAALDRGENITVLDVRSPESYDSSDVKIKGAIRLERDEILAHLNEIPRAARYVTYCT